MTGSAAAIPKGQSVDIALRDGSTVHIRPVEATDRDAIRAFVESLSSDSISFIRDHKRHLGTVIAAAQVRGVGHDRAVGTDGRHQAVAVRVIDVERPLDDPVQIG